MIIYVDIDDTICFYKETTSGEIPDYSLALPLMENIKRVNELYENGHTIIYWTARGAVSGIDHTKLTETQLSTWGCKYQQLKLDKPHFDIFIDDKVLNSRDWENNKGPFLQNSKKGL